MKKVGWSGRETTNQVDMALLVVPSFEVVCCIGSYGT